MIDLAYVKRKKRKKAAAIISAVGTFGVVTLIILALIGKRLGNFTVKMENHGVSLAFAEDANSDVTTTFLSLNNVPAYSVYYYSHMMDHYSDDVMDSTESNGKIGARTDADDNVTGTYFFKYTFYLRNVGKTDAIYNSRFYIDATEKPKNVSYDLADLLRVKFYDNAADEATHTSEIYAKKDIAFHQDENGAESYDTFVGKDDDNKIVGGYATQFVDDKIVFNRKGYELKAGEVRRITFVTWLEVTDPQASGTTPDKTSIKLSMNIDAHEI
ncbi:MAG: hypothetical protein MJ220_03850 [Bacilli bacterium]|nr:hypothetical protein [Bacilli bacterium]